MNQMKCPSCGGDQCRVVETIDGEQLATAWKNGGIDVRTALGCVKSIHLRLCLRCDLQFFSPVICGGPELYRDLQKNNSYYMDDKWEYRKALAEINTGNRVCEVGCGTGAFVKRVNDSGKAKAFGLEMNPDAVAVAVDHGIPVFCDSLERFKERQQDAVDVVCAFQVLEHLQDPLAFVRLAVEMLGHGGRIILSMPNRHSFMKWCGNILDLPPHHVTRWSGAAIEHLLAGCGCHHIKVSYEPLATYHVSHYADSLVRRARGTALSGVLAHWRVKKALHTLTSVAPVRALIRGHTLYVSAVVQ